MTDAQRYSEDSIDWAAADAMAWLRGNSGVGHPRSWAQEAKNTKRRGYDIYEHPYMAPPIAGYEALERMGYVERVGVAKQDGNERVMFRLLPAGRDAPDFDDPGSEE